MDLSRLAVLCDFDGTACLEDVGHRLFQRFAGEASREAVARWMRGELNTRQCLVLECAAVQAGREELLAYVGEARLDPTFARLVALSRAVPFPLLVVSEGLDFYIRHILERHGLGDVPFEANQAVFGDEASLADEASAGPGPGRLGVRFARGESGCASCGNCKGFHVRRFRGAGRTVVFAGDGLSDRCGAREADLTFAREGRDLARWCAAEGIPHLVFARLGEVAERLESARWESLVEEARR